MADYSIYQIAVGETGSTYPKKYDNFVLISKAYAEEVEAAREGQANLVTNLNTYAKYTLAANIVGGAAWKCTGMRDGTPASQDYCTVNQAISLVGSSGVVPTAITDLVPGTTLAANDILVVDAAGTGIEGRSTVYTAVPALSLSNGNYDMNLSTNRSTTLPTGIAGMVISYADIEGQAGISGDLTITPAGGEKIMNQVADVTLVIDDYPYCSFDLVYIDAAFGWTIARFQR